MEKFTLYVPIPENEANKRLYDELLRAMQPLGFQIGPAMTITVGLKEHTVRALTIPVDQIDQLKGYVQ